MRDDKLPVIEDVTETLPALDLNLEPVTSDPLDVVASPVVDLVPDSLDNTLTEPTTTVTDALEGLGDAEDPILEQIPLVDDPLAPVQEPVESILDPVNPLLR